MGYTASPNNMASPNNRDNCNSGGVHTRKVRTRACTCGHGGGDGVLIFLWTVVIDLGHFLNRVTRGGLPELQKYPQG
jgi:hypothetical protein